MRFATGNRGESSTTSCWRLSSAVYAIDLFVQFSNLRAVWPKWRWVVLLVGTALAAAFAHVVFSAAINSNSQ